jgi:hypothetical protein
VFYTARSMQTRLYTQINMTQIEKDNAPLAGSPSHEEVHMIIINRFTTIGFIIMFAGSLPTICMMLFSFMYIELCLMRYTSINCFRRAYVAADEPQRILAFDIYLQFLTRIVTASTVISPAIFFLTTNQMVNAFDINTRVIFFGVYTLLAYVLHQITNDCISDISKDDRLHLRRSSKILERLEDSIDKNDEYHHDHHDHHDHHEEQKHQSPDKPKAISDIPITNNTASSSIRTIPKVKTYRITGDMRKTVSSYLEMYSLYDDDKIHSV